MSSVANKYRHLYTLYTSEFHISEMRAALAKIDVLDKDSEAGKRQQIVSGSHKRAGTPYAVDIQRDTEGLDQKTLICFRQRNHPILLLEDFVRNV